MRKRAAFLVLCLLIVVGAASTWSARRKARAVAEDAAHFARAELTAANLPAEWKRALLAVEDPGFYAHHGIDVWTPGAGWTTLTQALAKRYCFARFHPGVLPKAWQSWCALVIDREVAKDAQLTLFLNRASFGEGETAWIEGFPDAARAFYGKPFSRLTRGEFIALVAMLVAPADLDPRSHPAALAERTRRIERLLAGQCAPAGFRDVMLDACR